MSNFYEKGWKKEYFLITPEEFRDVFRELHFVVTNTGVKKKYIETLPEKVFLDYETLYGVLKSGKELNFERDWPILRFSTGVTAHMENIHYMPMSRLSVPAFSEPCIHLSLFPLINFRDKLEKTFEVSQFPNHICGIEMRLPKTILYEDDSEINSFADSETWDIIVGKIKSMTSVLKLETGSGIKNTKIRVSGKAKLDLRYFNVVRELEAKII